ncbi:MAG: aldo/keto reductase [Burkholderiales bacterium]|nr:aldo/keto reductase [Burkholderiales bacterium]
MKRRQLGHSGPIVSALGLGMGGATTHFGERDDEVQVATMRRAIDLGLNFFDTADAYQQGRHEILVGRAIRDRRDEVIVASKFGNLTLPDGSKSFNGRPEYVARACDASLKRLGIDTIDLYYLHRIDPDVPITDTVGAMAELVRKGKVRYLGLCEAGPRSLERAHEVHPITALQTEYSLWARHVEAEILPACRMLGIGFVAYAPLARGLLTGTVQRYEDIASHDIRRKHPRFLPGNLEHNLALLRPLEEIAAAHGASPVQIALAWLLARGKDVVPIPGTKQQKYLEQNMGALDIVLAQHEIERLSAGFHPGAGAGERLPPGYTRSVGA